MKLYRFSGFAAMAALACSAALSAQAPVVPQAAGEAAERQIVLNGCVVKADKGYALADATEQARADVASSTYGRTAPDPFHGRVLYWLDDDDDLKDHAGHRVEVTGKTKGRLEKGEIEVDRKDEGLEIEFKADGDTVKMMVPYPAGAVGTSGTMPDKDTDYNVAVVKVDVKSVKKIADTCR